MANSKKDSGLTLESQVEVKMIPLTAEQKEENDKVRRNIEKDVHKAVEQLLGK